MSDVSKPTSLVSKLAEVMAAVGRIPKRGKNAHFGYQYATEADVADVLREELSQRHVLMVMGVTDILTTSGAKQDTTLVKMTVTFYDGDSDATLAFPWAGAGQDSGEKGLYKAMTGAEKYALLKTFLVPTGDDPEDDSRTAAKPAPRAVAPAVRPAAAPVAAASPATSDPNEPIYITKIDKRNLAGNKVGYIITTSDKAVLRTTSAEIGGRAENFATLKVPVHVIADLRDNKLYITELSSAK